MKDTKGIVRNRKSNDRQSNDHMKKRTIKTNNDLQNNTQNTRARATRTSLTWCVNWTICTYLVDNLIPDIRAMKYVEFKIPKCWPSLSAVFQRNVITRRLIVSIAKRRLRTVNYTMVVCFFLLSWYSDVLFTPLSLLVKI